MLFKFSRWHFLWDSLVFLVVVKQRQKRLITRLKKNSFVDIGEKTEIQILIKVSITSTRNAVYLQVPNTVMLKLPSFTLRNMLWYIMTFFENPYIFWKRNYFLHIPLKIFFFDIFSFLMFYTNLYQTFKKIKFFFWQG